MSYQILLLRVAHGMRKRYDELLKAESQEPMRLERRADTMWDLYKALCAAAKLSNSDV